ncbi:MAG: pyridoxamine 5'-phosphate oxidase family protein [Actinomycetales bacterium]
MEPAVTPAPRVPAQPATRVRRLPDKQRHDRADLDAVLDASLVGQVGFVDPADARPYVVTVGLARDGDRVLVHGSSGSRALRALASGVDACLSVTLLDGMVWARSVFEMSMHYRGAMVMGRFRALDGDEALEGLRLISEHLVPGAWGPAREPNRKELAATLVLELPLTHWSVKVSDGWPDDAEADLDRPVWAGVVSIETRWGRPVSAPDLHAEAPQVPNDGVRARVGSLVHVARGRQSDGQAPDQEQEQR